MSAVFNLVPAVRKPALDPTRAAFARDVLDGLAQARKRIPSHWLHDARGSALFDAITSLDEYYPARNEMWVLERCAYEIAQLAGPRATLVEIGRAGRHTPILLDALESPSAYIAIDRSGPPLIDAAHALHRRYARLHVEPVVADAARLTALPALARGVPGGRRVVLIAGAALGRHAPEAAGALLAQIGKVVGPDALLVAGIDTTHDPALLLPAYDDARGVTAAFNLNLLTRINRELGADFSPSAFRHSARHDAAAQCVELQLASQYTQRVSLLGNSLRFDIGETIQTARIHQFGLIKFQAIAQRAGWSHRQLWMDGQSRVAVHVLERAR